MNTPSTAPRRTDALGILLPLTVFCINAMIFIAFYDPEIQGYSDAVRGWQQFNNLMFGGEWIWGPHNQIELRILMVFTTLVELGILVSLRLIERRTALIFLLLPMAAYLSTKLRIEFLLFPMAIISLNLSWRKEALVWGLLLLTTTALQENNGIIILAFRAAAILFRYWKPRLISLGVFVLIIFIIDANAHLLLQFVPRLQVYSYTRDIVNPEYTIFETAIVFTSSMVLSINPSVDYLVGIPSTILITLLTFGRSIFSLSEWRRWLRTPGFQASFLAVLLFTSVTHVFQNARYYFFYVHAFGGDRGVRAQRALTVLSVPITLVMTGYYKLVLGM